MGSPPIARRCDTLRRCPGVASGRGTLLQAGVDLLLSAAGESLEKSKSLHESKWHGKHYYIHCNNNYVVCLQKKWRSSPSMAISSASLEGGLTLGDSKK